MVNHWRTITEPASEAAVERLESRERRREGASPGAICEELTAGT